MSQKYQVFDGTYQPIMDDNLKIAQEMAAHFYFGDHEVEWEESPRMSPEENRVWECEQDGIVIYVVEKLS